MEADEGGVVVGVGDVDENHGWWTSDLVGGIDGIDLIRQEGTAIYIAVTIVGVREMSLPMIMNTPVALLLCIMFVLLTRGSVKKQTAESS